MVPGGCLQSSLSRPIIAPPLSGLAFWFDGLYSMGYTRTVGLALFQGRSKRRRRPRRSVQRYRGDAAPLLIVVSPLPPIVPCPLMYCTVQYSGVQYVLCAATPPRPRPQFPLYCTRHCRSSGKIFCPTYELNPWKPCPFYPPVVRNKVVKNLTSTASFWMPESPLSIQQ
jgi:hypothetical protein